MTDLISRQWLLDLYETPKDGEGVDWKVPLEVVRQNILDAPSAEAVQGVGRYEKAMQKLQEMPRYLNGVKAKQINKIPPEAVQGEWTDIDDYYRMATCSRCHKVTMFEKWGEYTKPYNFCPNCGAKMSKGGGNE